MQHFFQTPVIYFQEYLKFLNLFSIFIIFSNISEILFMCITQFSPESKVKKWRQKIVYVFFIRCHNGIGYEEKIEEENLDSGMVAKVERKRSL